MSNPNEDEEPKLIIDEDWKTQVQREKEQLKQQKEHPADQPTDDETVAAPAASSSEADEDEQPLPPANFQLLVSSMATQAVAAMGQLPGDDGQPLPMRLDYAKHYIDLLGVIESKTTGNLTDAEKSFLQGTLHQLRMLFVSVKK